jgi:hypothetical protein
VLAAASEAVPGAVTAMLASSQQPAFNKADIGAMRRISATEPRWILPASNGELCLTELAYPLVAQVSGKILPPVPTLNCVSVAAAEAGELIYTRALVTSTTTRPTLTQVVGVVPNGITTVRIVLQPGREMSVPVIQNAYEALATDPRDVQFTIGEGDRQRVRIVPVRTFEAQNSSPH